MVVAGVRRGQQMLAAVLDPAHRIVEFEGERGEDDLLRDRAAPSGRSRRRHRARRRAACAAAGRGSRRSRRAPYAASGSRHRSRSRRAGGPGRQARRALPSARRTAGSCGIRGSRRSSASRAAAAMSPASIVRSLNRLSPQLSCTSEGGRRASARAHRRPHRAARNRPRRRRRGPRLRRGSARRRQRSPRRHSAPCRSRAAARPASARPAPASRRGSACMRGRSAAVKTRPLASGRHGDAADPRMRVRAAQENDLHACRAGGYPRRTRRALQMPQILLARQRRPDAVSALGRLHREPPGSGAAYALSTATHLCRAARSLGPSYEVSGSCGSRIGSEAVSVIGSGTASREDGMGRVEGKVALVAGAGGGIGGAGAEGLAREGAAVLCADIDDGARPRRPPRASAPPAGGPRRSALDVRDRAAVDAAVAAAVREFGRLDIAARMRRDQPPAEFSRPRRRDLGPHHRGQPDRHVPSGAGGGAADGRAREAAAASST